MCALPSNPSGSHTVAVLTTVPQDHSLQTLRFSWTMPGSASLCANWCLGFRSASSCHPEITKSLTFSQLHLPSAHFFPDFMLCCLIEFHFNENSYVWLMMIIIFNGSGKIPNRSMQRYRISSLTLEWQRSKWRQCVWCICHHCGSWQEWLLKCWNEVSLALYQV